MLLLRLLTTGVCVACLVILATGRLVRLEVAAPDEAPGAPQPVRTLPAALSQDHRGQLSVVDIAPGVARSALVTLVGLRPEERILAVNDQPVDEDLDAGLLIQSMARSGGFLDLTVAAATAERRVLVLLH